ncbi:MAG TPA: FAD-dependent oxidoreductase [Anaerolineae bacterium]|nr:FAD-dependent oxidoreductase [Anaerolineae bacterium]
MSDSNRNNRFHVIVIGAGSTGSATAHDLALRGFKVTVIDRGEIASGTTGRNHCLLHSGGRYAVKDPEGAIECIEENMIIRKIMPDALELNDGLFVATDESDLAFKAQFLEGCAACKIPAREIPIERALQIEPYLNPKILAAIQVPDGVFEPYRFCLAFLATAKKNGATVLPYHLVTGLRMSGIAVTGVKVRDNRTMKDYEIGADLVVNASGPWADKIAIMANVDVPVKPTAGVMVTIGQRLNQMVVNRLNKPSDGDIVVPQRQTSIIGTTSWPVDDMDAIEIPREHVEKMIAMGERLIPMVRRLPIRGVMAVARPLISKPGVDEREVSRTFECFDHKHDGVENFVTISGGKTTTARAMAEKVSNIVCEKLGVQAECHTRETRLESFRLYYN